MRKRVRLVMSGNVARLQGATIRAYESASFLQATGSTLALQILVSHRACLNAQGAKPGAAVETMFGQVHGLASPGVIAFKGLRYGDSTTGANRFQPPVKPAACVGRAEPLANRPHSGR